MPRLPPVALALTFVIGCQVAPVTTTPAPTGAQSGGTVRVALPAEVTTLDPWNADAASLIATRQIFETLVVIDPATSAITPGLASSWQATNDGATWTFTLRDGVRFHDGALLDATAVVSSFDRGRAARSYQALFDSPSAITRVVAVDSRTVRFDLRAPFGPFLAHLAAPQAAVARTGGAGTGPFVASADALAPDGALTLKRSDAYWRRDGSGRTLPYLDGLVLRPVRDAPSRLAELRAGRVDIALDLPVAQASAARSDPSLIVAPRRDAALASLGIDTTQPPFDRLEARRAVALALNRNALAAVYGGTSRPATQVAPPGMLGYDDSVVEFAPLDEAAARRALTDAHMATPINAVLAYPSLPTTAYPDPQRVAQSLAADLGKIGIVARVRAVEAVALRDERATFTLDTSVVGLDPDDVFWPLFGSDDPANTTLVVGLLRKARSEADASKRAELYKQVSKIARTDALRVPLVFADRTSASSARLTGYTAGGIEYFGTVWLRP
jgi:ABC-type transport system substrate-binding protein